MDGLWRLKTTGLAGFVKSLGEDIEGGFVKNEFRGDLVEMGQRSDHADNCFLLTWEYNHKHSGEIMITRKPYGSSNLIIDQFWGVKPIPNARASSPGDLRTAAKIYEGVSALLVNRFGQPVGDHDGRTIYRGRLEKVAQTSTSQ